MRQVHVIQEISFVNNHLFIIIDGVEFKFPLSKVSKKLEIATDMERNLFKISPSGYGIHWPLIDEDLAVSALLKLA